MVMNDRLGPREAALGWLVRTNDPEFEAWDEFTAWLETDKANADAYHALAASEAEMLRRVEAATPARAPARKSVLRPYAWGSGLAAVAAMLAVIAMPRFAPVEYQTQPGEIRAVSLGGRDQLVMNGGTKLAVGGWFKRSVRLEQGQVLVALREPGRSNVAVLSGDLKLIDVGTVFEVARDGRDTRVIVSEGAVLADPDGARLAIDAGERLDTTDGANVLQAAPAEAASVGSFRRGQLTYVDEPITHVVADLRRSTGLDISAAEAIRARRFTGTLSVAEVKRDPRSLGALLGLSIEPSGSGWELQGRS
jgi:transmembrane sensor